MAEKDHLFYKIRILHLHDSMPAKPFRKYTFCFVVRNVLPGMCRDILFLIGNAVVHMPARDVAEKSIKWLTFDH